MYPAPPNTWMAWLHTSYPSRIGPAAAAALAEKPELTVTVVLLIAIPETVAILGFVIAVLILMQGGG